MGDIYNLKQHLESLDREQLIFCLQARDILRNILLHRAAICGHAHIIDLLLGTHLFKQHIPISLWEDYSGAAAKVQEGDKEIWDPLNVYRHPPLNLAIVHGHTKVVEVFIKDGFEFNGYCHGDYGNPLF